MLSASVDRALVRAASEVVVLADHTKLATDTMFQTVPPDLITRLVTDEPPAHDERAAMELQALADLGVQVSVAGAVDQPPAAAQGSGSGGDTGQAGGRPRRDMPLPGQRRTHSGSGTGGPTPHLRSATAPQADQPGERSRVADLRRR